MGQIRFIARTGARAPSEAAGPARPRRAVRLAARGRLSLPWLATAGFGYLAAFADAASIVLAAFGSRGIYHLLTFGLAPSVEPVTSAGGVVATLVVLTTLQRGEYQLKPYFVRSGQFTRALPVWNLAILVALTLGFATKTTAIYSRGAVGVFYIVGFIAMVGARRALVEIAEVLRAKQLAAPRRVLFVGFEDRLQIIGSPREPARDGVEFLGSIALRDNQAFLRDDLALAGAAVRLYRPDDVYLAIPWTRADLIESCMEAFRNTPVQVHLGGDEVLDRYGESKVARVGSIFGLTLTHAPLTRWQRLQKRAFDIVFASAALILLSPLLALTALLIRLDSPGPALFRQKRYGFNQEPFRIYKFRSMTTMEDGASIEQAKRSDPRVTRVGRFIRRHSIDELPQLLNVLMGDMSLIGPRPHALAHDQRYVERLARYARRHNVKPGISGWAQVHGHRGEIANDEEMQSRLAADLYYVDNWSLWLDVKIVVMTIFSARAHKNAF